MLLRGIYLHRYRSLILTAGKTFLLAAQKSNLHKLFTQLLVSHTVYIHFNCFLFALNVHVTLYTDDFYCSVYASVEKAYTDRPYDHEKKP
jgi:hypothetical protein